MLPLLLLLCTLIVSGDLYSNYTIFTDPGKASEWSSDLALHYVTTVRLLTYDHHIFQYRRYPCQYFYTDEIQIPNENETVNQCQYNTSTIDYEYRFQLHLHSKHVEPVILRHLAVHCIYINCSLSLLSLKYLQIDWNDKGRQINPNCSFDHDRLYAIINTGQSTVSDWIAVRCQSLIACNQSRSHLESSLASQVRLTYGSAYELDTPYCSLESSVNHVLETNLAKTNRLLEELVGLIRRGFGTATDREQAKLKDSFSHSEWLSPEKIKWWILRAVTSTSISLDLIALAHICRSIRSDWTWQSRAEISLYREIPIGRT